MKILKTIRDNYGYFKKGVAESQREYEILQKIKNTPPNFRTKAQIEYAASKNKTKNPMKVLGGFKKGGKVKKTGLYELHKGEKVLTKKQVKHTNLCLKKKSN